jgi:hypothetical protein
LIRPGFLGPTVIIKSKREEDANMTARHLLQTCATLSHTYSFLQ